MLGRKRRTLGITGIFCLLLLSALSVSQPVLSAGEEIAVDQQLDRLSEEVYQFIKKEQYAEAKDKLEELAELFTQQRTELALGIEEVEMMARTIVSAKRAFSAVQADTDRLQWYALQIRLMCDALSHTHQPLWLHYYSLFAKQVEYMNRHAGNKEIFLQELEQNHQLYLTLRPAILISRSATETEEFDSLYHFLRSEGQKQQPEWEAVAQALQQLKEQTHKTFRQKELPTAGYGIAAGSPYLIIGGVGTIIISTLAYVVWRKYQGEKTTAFRSR